MSGYRPKSLEELNSRYDQVLSADRAIKKGVSGIRESENAPKKEAAGRIETSETESLVKKAAGARNVEDISGAVDDFIRHLNNDYAVQPRRQEPARQEMPPQSRPQPRREESVPPASPYRPAKPEPVATPESVSDDRSDLLDDYMKVMTDQYEDEDDLSDSSAGGYLKRKSRKRRKDRFAPASEIQQPEASTANEEPAPLPDVDYNDTDYMAKTAEVLPQDPPVSEIAEPDADKEAQPESLGETFERLDSQGKREKGTKKAKKGKGRIVLRTLLSLMLAAVIVATAAVASLVLVLKVNTGNPAFERYYFVTTTASFEEANLKAGDLVICEAGEAIDDNRFVLCVDRNAGSFFFGKKNGGIVDAQGNIMYLIDGQGIYTDNVLGSVKRSFGHIGTVIDFIFRFYIPVLAVLLVAAIGLILLVVIALRNKNKPVKVKKEKHAEADNEPDEADGTQVIVTFEDNEDESVSDSREEEKKSRKNKKKKEKKHRRQEEVSEPEAEAEGEEGPESDVKFDSEFDSFSDI